MTGVCAFETFEWRLEFDVKRTLWTSAVNVAVGEGFWMRPLARRSCGLWGRRSKASQGGNRGQEWALVWLGAIYGDLRIADCSRVSQRGRMACSLAGGTDDSGRVRSLGCAGLARARRPEEDWRPREDIGSRSGARRKAKAISTARREAPRRTT